MESVNVLQPGTMIPASCDILIVDLKDCFFTISLHTDDTPKFAFIGSSINNTAPVQRYQWCVLLEGMRNSPMICHCCVAQVLPSVREPFAGAYCYHYMDDTLIATQTKEELSQIQPSLLQALKTFGLQVAPWKYLGLKVMNQTVQPQAIQFSTKIQTLNDAQKTSGCYQLGQTISRINQFTISTFI